MAFHRDSGSGGKRGGQRFGGPKKSFGGGSFGGGSRGYGDKPAMKFPATCAECGERCVVPFKPNGSKPVLCSNCFGGSHEGGSSSYAPKRFDRAPAAPSGLEDKLREINNKLDHIIRSLSDES